MGFAPGHGGGHVLVIVAVAPSLVYGVHIGIGIDPQILIEAMAIPRAAEGRFVSVVLGVRGLWWFVQGILGILREVLIEALKLEIVVCILYWGQDEERIRLEATCRELRTNRW